MRRLFCLLLVLPLVMWGGVPEAQAQETQDFIVVFANQMPADFEDAALELGFVLVDYFEEVAVAVVRGDPGNLKHLKRLSGVQHAGPQSIFAAPQAMDLKVLEEDELEGLAGPGDLWMIYGWDIKRVTGNGATYAWQTGNHDVVVGIIDTGIDFSHPDLAANIVPGSKTFVPGTTDAWDENGHGTHVAGTIAANGRFIGVAPNTGIRAYRVFGAEGGAASGWIIAALIAAADDGVDVINMSLGGYRLLTDKDHVADTVAYMRAIRYAVNSGAVVVVSAGNEAWSLTNPNKLAREFGIKNGAVVNVPGGLPGTITVSATDVNDQLSSYSNYGQGVIDVTAPGGDFGPSIFYYCVSTYPGGWAGMIGTSMSAPKVSGIAALIRAEYGDIPPAQVVNMIKNNTDKLDGNGYSRYFGWGMVNAYNLIR